MELRQLAHFEALYRLCSFVRAAEEQSITQSAFSRSLKSLELELGQQLFDRTTHSVAPTAAADRLIPYARDALRVTAAMEEEARGTGQPRGGLVMVGTSPYPVQPLLSLSIAHFAVQEPAARISLVPGSADALLQALIERELDLVVCDIRKFSATGFSDDILVKPLPREPVVLVCAAHHPLSQGGVTRALLRAYPWALPAPPEQVARQMAGPVIRGRPASLFPHYRVETTAACIDIVREGLVLTALPQSLARRACAAGDLVFQPLPDSVSTNDGIHSLRRRTQSSTVRAFAECIQMQARRLVE